MVRVAAGGRSVVPDGAGWLRDQMGPILAGAQVLMDEQELRDALNAAQASLERATGALRSGEDADELDLSAAAASMLRQRRKRDACFPPNLFGEYEWDMLLVLFSANQEMRQIDVFNGSGVPPTTGLRIMRRLEEMGLLAIRGGGSIYQKRLVRLTDAAVESMTQFLRGQGGS
jgi:hypothetical protein